MTTKETRIPLPDKLLFDFEKKCRDVHISAFKDIVNAVSVDCPEIRIKEQKRSCAFYFWGRPIAYIEPQNHRILIGLFRRFIQDAKKQAKIPFTDFPEWNKSKGGLVGVSLGGYRDEIALQVNDIAYLIIESYNNS